MIVETEAPVFIARTGLPGARHLVEAPEDGNGAPAGSGLPAPSTKTSREPSGDEKRVTDLNARISARRVAAEDHAKNYGLPHAGEKVDAKDPKDGEKKPVPVTKAKATEGEHVEGEKKPDEEKPAELAALEKEHAEVQQRLAGAEQKLSEWDDLGEQISARLEANKQHIARLEALLKRANVAVDPRDLEILRLREQDTARRMSDERTQAMVKQQEDAERQRADAVASEQRRAGYQAIAAKFPDLTMATEHGKRFWSVVWNGGNNLEPAAAMALAPQFISSAEAKPPAPRLLKSGAGQSGDAKPQTRQDYVEKWKSRARAV